MRRRDVLKAFGSAIIARAALPQTAQAVRDGACTQPYYDQSRFVYEAAPFQLGVASGDPTPTSVILWTRLSADVCDPAGFGGLSAPSLPVQWQVATDPGFKDLVQSGTAAAPRELAYSVHVDVGGLKPATTYYYRFSHADKFSAPGRTRTAAPSAGAVRFAFLSCQDFNSSYAPFEALADEPLDFVLHLGDTIYEHAWGDIVTDLPGFRHRHALFRGDPQARKAWASHPFVVTWDDHEVADNYYGGSPAFDARRTAGYQAFYEHMPIRPPAGIPGSAGGPSSWKDLRVYRRFQFGGLVDLSVLDLRQYRNVKDLTRVDPAATTLGAEQKAWLKEAIAAPAAAWTVLGSPLTMADFSPGIDSWEGYQRERAEILRHVRDRGIKDLIVVSGDAHRTLISSLLAGDAPGFAPIDTPVGVEFNGTSIASASRVWHPPAEPGQPPPAPVVIAEAADPDRGFVSPTGKPWIAYREGTYRGYGICDVTPQKWTTTLRVHKDYRIAKPCMTTLVSYSVARGSGRLALESRFVPFADDAGAG